MRWASTAAACFAPHASGPAPNLTLHLCPIPFTQPCARNLNVTHRRDITKGTELVYDYSYERDSVPGVQITCHCGAAACKGRLL